ncbi:hypothetical protein SD457_11215 [Coprobacillaceae bacterium CR2/5/TPMF4]|nr:hypothetical protein SD457_11215 [Coprobacillaceae bacterium CR2/5/TPMF4]
MVIESLLINAVLLTIPLMCDLCSGIIDNKIIYLLYFIEIFILLISVLTTLYAKKLRHTLFEKNPKDLYDILKTQYMNYKSTNKLDKIYQDTYMSLIYMYQEIFINNKNVNDKKQNT